MKSKKMRIPFVIEYEKEVDGRWIAEIPHLPGVMAYGSTKLEATRAVYAIALRTIADAIEHGPVPSPISKLFSSYGVAIR